ncbi:MAG: hypothetical protein UX42_C0007G0004 [Microgenomates group bacterium GW2011_GWC1_46_20]|nr:MAG: hypothetical protein UX42_C0007G0004 [Microgenomates group bacterium GW2011_GWC1_46_20]
MWVAGSGSRRGGGGRADARGGGFAKRVSAETLVAEKIGFAVVVATAGTATGIGFAVASGSGGRSGSRSGGGSNCQGGGI